MDPSDAARFQLFIYRESESRPFPPRPRPSLPNLAPQRHRSSKFTSAPSLSVREKSKAMCRKSFLVLVSCASLSPYPSPFPHVAWGLRAFLWLQPPDVFWPGASLKVPASTMLVATQRCASSTALPHPETSLAIISSTPL
jgi:hypothetical protein